MMLLEQEVIFVNKVDVVLSGSNDRPDGLYAVCGNPLESTHVLFSPSMAQSLSDVFA